MELYQRVDGWVRLLAVPPHTPDLIKRSDLLERSGLLVGSAVTLRYQGRIVGRGTACSDTGDTLVLATHAAITEALRRLPSPAGVATSPAAFAPLLTISLELSGSFIPISPRTFSELDLQIQRGVEGVAARAPQGIHAMFPAGMLLNITAPADAMVAAISAASGDPTLAIKDNPKGQPPAISAHAGLVLYRFASTHLAQPRPGLAPIFLFRGGKPVQEQDITLQSMITFRDSLAGYLLRWDALAPAATLAPGPAPGPAAPLHWPPGTLVPAKATYEPPVASLAEFAVVTLALHRYAARALPGEPSLHAAQALQINDRFRYQRLAALDEILDPQQTQPPSDQTRATPQAIIPKPAGPLAACLHALILMAPLEGTPPARREMPAPLPPLDEQLVSVYSQQEGWNTKVPENTRAFAAFVLAKRAMLIPGDPQGPPLRLAAESAVRSIFRDTKPTMLVMHMPWLGWAETTLSPDTSQPLPAAAALRDMRDMVERFQLTHNDAGDEGPDLVGGIVFTTSSQLLPTSHSLRPLAFLATMIGDPRLTDPAEKLPHLARLLLGIRFARQLAFDQSCTWATPDPDRALWGIRTSTWDSRITPEATALALLSLCETIDSLQTAPAAPIAPAPRFPNNPNPLTPTQ